MPKGDELTGKQRAWLDRFMVSLNATEAARGIYDTDDYSTLQTIGSENMSKPVIKAEIDRRLAARAMGADELLARVSEQARLDIGPYMREDGTLDLQRMAQEGKSRLIKELTPTREGLKVSLTDPQVAQKMLARYHRLLGDRLEVDLTTSVDIDKGSLDALAAQLRAAASADSVTPDSVGDDDSTE